MYKPLWEQIIGKMRKSTSYIDGGMYLDQVFYLSEEEGLLVLGTPSKLFKEKLESMGFRKRFEEELSEQNGSGVAVKIEIAKKEEAASDAS